MNSGAAWTIADGGIPRKPEADCAVLPPFPSSPASPTTFDPGITLRAIGFPVDMFTALFGVARTVGWIAQWQEMIEDPEQGIGPLGSSMLVPVSALYNG
jgi:Citrate synthase, C-terminal domain